MLHCPKLQSIGFFADLPKQRLRNLQVDSLKTRLQLHTIACDGKRTDHADLSNIKRELLEDARSDLQPEDH